MKMTTIDLIILCVCVCVVTCETQTRPNIVLFIADDLGWNDVGFHGSNHVPTPNIDALAYSGLVLHNYYVAPICTPTRAALLTGKYPIHSGMQHGVIYGAEPRGLPLSEKILPQYLKELGYSTHLVGKWHLGHYKKEYLPLNRGFDSHLGFWTGKIDMYDHTSREKGSWGFDFRRGFQVAHDLFGQYATDIYTNEAIKIVRAHNVSRPLFLTVAHSAAHSGNPEEPVRAPDALVDKFKHIDNYQRRKFAAVVSKLDESVGAVIEALKERGLLDNCVILFTTDNGGPAAGFNDNAASNFPLRGVKNTLWEGGVRGAGVLWGAGAGARLASQRLHVVDWLPTLLAAAGADVSFLDIDGINQWENLSKDLKSPRTTVVHNIDDIWQTASITVDQWKLIKGASNYNGTWDSWYGPAERDGAYDVQAVYGSRAAAALASLGRMPDTSVALHIRELSTLKCNSSIPTTAEAVDGPYLFNIEDDPCEYNNLAYKEPDVVRRMMAELERVNATAVPPNAAPQDPRGDPKYWGRVYTNFGNYQTDYVTGTC